MKNNVLTKVIAVDWQNLQGACNNAGRTRTPRWKYFENQIKDDQVDILEQLIFVAERVPENDTAEEIARVSTQLRNLKTALQRSTAAKVITCPAKRSQDGFKQSDDQRLMIKTLALCLRLKPDFLTLFAGDGDYAPLVWELRDAGIRTEVVGRNVAGELQEAAYHVVDLDQLLENIAKEEAA